MGKKDKNKELQKIQGLRLKECREKMGYTQQKLSELVGYSSEKYISMFETGARKINWEQAHLFANALSVTPEYLMCQSDNQQESPRYIVDLGDNYMLALLNALGHKILIESVTLSGEDFETSLFNLGDNVTYTFSLNNPHCRIESNGIVHDTIISHVLVDGVQLTFGEFSFWINRMYDYINYTISNLHEFEKDRVFCRALDMEIEEKVNDK